VAVVIISACSQAAEMLFEFVLYIKVCTVVSAHVLLTSTRFMAGTHIDCIAVRGVHMKVMQ
jgi:hypothetical protein